MKERSFSDIIRNGLAGLFHIFAKELKATVRDEGVLIFFLLVPLAYPLVYAFIYTNEVVREVPAAVVDDNNSTLSRKYLRLMDASADVQIQSYCADMEEAKSLMKEKKVYGVIHIPESFSRDISQGRQTQVNIYCDMSGMLYYKAILLSATNASLTVNEQIKIQRMGNTTQRQDEVSTAPIEYEDISLFNPQDRFASFLIPAVLMLILQQTLLLGIGMSAGTARETNRFKDLVPIGRHYEGTLRIVFGKSMAYLLIYIAISAYVLCAVPQMFSLVQIAQPSTLMAFIFPYLLACIFFAMTCSIFIHHREACMLVYVFTSIPLLFISGISGREQQFHHSGKYFLAVSLNLRNQWIRTNQQYGSDLAGSLAGVSGLMDTSRSLFSDNLSGLPPASHAQPPACPRTSPEVKKRKRQPSFHLACNDQHDLYQYSGCCSGSCPKRQDRLSHYGQKVKR